MTNEGAYYRAGIDPAALPKGQLPLMLSFDQPAASGPYGRQQAFTAVATQDGAPVAGLPITFYLGGQGRLAVTSSDGQATAHFFLLAQPGSYTLSATFAGSETYAPASADGSFEITQGTSAVVLEPAVQHVPFSLSTQVTATVTSAGLPLAGKSMALTVDASGTRLYTSVAVTDYAGRARWQVPALPVGAYTLQAWFGLPVTEDLDLSSPLYAGCFDTASLVVDPFSVGGFFAPVHSAPVVNKVKAGSSVPAKFTLGGYFGLEIFVSGYPIVRTINCQTGEVDASREVMNARTSGFAYDPLTGQYNYVWQTDKKWVNSCRALVLKFIDGTEKIALFQFTK